MSVILPEELFDRRWSGKRRGVADRLRTHSLTSSDDIDLAFFGQIMDRTLAIRVPPRSTRNADRSLRLSHFLYQKTKKSLSRTVSKTTNDNKQKVLLCAK